jgi:hypothetical protein
MDEGIKNATDATMFGYSATFTADGILKYSTRATSFSAGTFTSQKDIVTAFISNSVTAVQSGTFVGCTALKTIYVDNNRASGIIENGATESTTKVVYADDEEFINANEFLMSAIVTLKDSVKTIEDKANSDKTELSEQIQGVKNSALEEFANVNAELVKKEVLANKVNAINSSSDTQYPSTKAVIDFVDEQQKNPNAEIEKLKVEKVNVVDFNTYKTSNDSKVNNKVDSNDFDTYKNTTNKGIDKCVADIANNTALINQNSIKATTDKANSATINDSSNGNIIGLTLYGKSTQSAVPSPTNPVDINNINNPSITFSNDSDSQSINIQCTLRGIGNVCDTLTVNSDGTGYITQRLFAERITSQRKSTSLEWNYSKATHRFFRNDYSYSFDVKDNKPLILCSHLDVGENEKNTAFDNSIGWINVSGVGIAIRMTEFDGDIAKFKKWLDDNEVYVVAPRSKTITVNLSKDEVDKIISLHTYYLNTTIVSDCDCQVEYVADTKHYIDNKFNELATAIVAHESEVM